MAPYARGQRGLTMVELLTVLAIIALLIAILLPAVSQAREQSRIAKCMHNMHGIAQAAHAYMAEQRNALDLPWVIPARMIAAGATDSPYAFTNPSPFIWGGTIPDKMNEEFRNASPVYLAQISANAAATFDVYRIPPRYRPLNPFIAPHVGWDCEPSDDMDQPRMNPTETPDVFRCPSDSTAKIPTLGRSTAGGDDDSVFPTWQYWGNSYAINWHWGAYYFHAPPGDVPPYSGGGFQNRWYRNLGFYAPAPAGLGSRMMKDSSGDWNSNFILFMENRLNFSLEMAKPPGYQSSSPWFPGAPEPARGWHRQLSRHVAAFRDGSVRYQAMDNRHIYGDRWTVWPARPWQGRWSGLNEVAP